MSPREVALDYAARGWPVFPCRADKRPMTAQGFKDATCDAVTVERWWTDYPDALIGLPTGGRLVVVDVDVHGETNGYDAWHELVAELGAELEDTALVETPSGGLHAYYEANGHKVGSTAGRLAPGLDVRAEGGYVIAPGSAGYQCVQGHKLSRIRTLPDALAERLAYAREKPAAQVTEERIPEGQRNATLASLAGSMRRRGMTPQEITAALLAVNAARCRPPLTGDEVQAIAESVGAYEPARTAPVEEPRRPRVYSLKEIRAMEHVSREWLLEGLVARGNITMFAGAAKVGKSTFIAAAIAAVVDGRPFAGMATGRASILYVTEEGLVSFDELMARVCVPESDALKVMPRIETWGMNWPDLCGEIGAQVRDEGFGLVVVDTLDNLAGIIDQNDAGEARAAVSHLRPVAEAGAAVWVSRHNIKNETGNPVQDAAGSGSFSGAVDIVAGYYKRGAQREIKAVGRLDGIPERRLVEFDGIDFTPAIDPAERRDLEFERRIIGALPQGEANAMSAEAIARAAGSYRQKVQPLLRRLRETKAIMARRGVVSGASPQAIGYWLP